MTFANQETIQMYIFVATAAAGSGGTAALATIVHQIKMASMPSKLTK